MRLTFPSDYCTIEPDIYCAKTRPEGWKSFGHTSGSQDDVQVLAFDRGTGQAGPAFEVSAQRSGLFLEPAESADDATAPVDGYAKVQDIMDYVNALIEKKKDELAPVGGTPYLYTNGYIPGETPIELTDPLNAYQIVLDSNDEFVIELVHKNEEGGWFEIEGDPDANYYGTFFKVIIPSDYKVKTYRWDNDNSDYTINAEIDMPACNLVEGSSTPDNVTYYYKDAVDGYLFNGAKIAVEDEIALYNNHWLKLVVTKK